MPKDNILARSETYQRPKCLNMFHILYLLECINERI
nr:unnamed protein product [Callosobruchus chinensis]